MFKQIILAFILSFSANAMVSFNLPHLDFDMAEKAIMKSDVIQAAEEDLNQEVVDIVKIGKKTYRVTFEGGCDLTVKFGKKSKVNAIEDSFFCN